MKLKDIFSSEQTSFCNLFSVGPISNLVSLGAFKDRTKNLYTHTHARTHNNMSARAHIGLNVKMNLPCDLL